MAKQLTERTKKLMGIKSPEMAEVFRQYVGQTERGIDQTVGKAITEMDKFIGKGVLSHDEELEDFCRKKLSEASSYYLKLSEALGEINKAIMPVKRS